MSAKNIFGFSILVLILFTGIYLLILILQYYGIKKVYRYSKGMVLLTYLPKEYVDNPEVVEIISSAKKSVDRVQYIFLLLAIPITFTKIEISIKIFIIAIFLYLYVQGKVLNKYIYKLRDLKSKLYKEDELEYENNDYYDAFGYFDPNDKRIFVNNPISNMNYFINKGQKKGRIINYIFYLIVIVSIIPIFIVSTRTYKVEKHQDYIKISAGYFYKDEIKYSDIDSVRVIENLPDGRIIKLNGLGSDTQNYGSFRISKIGKVKLYIYDDSKKLLEIKRKKNYPVYFEGKEDSETYSMYHIIRTKIEDM